MNEQNNNTNGKVKSKFFNQDLFDDAKMNDVGSSTGGQVISWGVGGNRSTDKTVSDLSILDSTQMFNFVNTEVTDFEENNSYSNNISAENNYGMQDSNTGLFSGQQFANSMEGQVTIDNNVSQDAGGFTTNVNDVFAQAKFDSSVANNAVANEFVQDNPTFLGYNANPEIIAQNNSASIPNMAFDNNQMVQPVEPGMVQTNFATEQPVVDNMVQPMMEQNIQPMVNEPVQQNIDNTIVVPAFDPFNSMAEPVQPYVQETVATPAAPVEMSPDLQMQQNSPLFAMAAESQTENNNPFEKELQPLNIGANDGEINDDMRSNQPLSLMALSGESIDEEQKPKDVLENNKYFQNTPLEDNRLKIEEVVVPVAPVVDVLAEPTRDINVKELVKAFIGPKYTKISMSPFSFCGAFFNSFYFFFRKMYLQGLVIVVINFVLSILLFKSWAIGLGLYLGLFIVIGLLTNSLYLSHANKEVLKIIRDNPKLNQYELQKICIKKGGTNFLLALLINIVINSISTSLITMIVGVSALMGLMGGSQSNVPVNEKVKLEDLITYQLPTEFVLVNGSEAGDTPYQVIETVKVKGKETTISSCKFNIMVVKTNYDAEEYIQKLADSENRYNRTSSFETGTGVKWAQYSYEGADYDFYYRAKDFDDNVVLVKYLVHENAPEGKCELHLENIMTSINKNRD